MSENRPNILFILTDQMRADAMGCMGHPVVQTPNLDKLARDGVLFTNGVSNCPVCTPSRAGLMTGRYPLSHRTLTNDVPMPTDQSFFAESFRDAGYVTGHIGKWHLDGIPRDKFTPPGPRRAGFDGYWATFNCSHQYDRPRYFLDTDDLVEEDGYEPEVQTRLAVEFIEDHKDDPFFLMLSWGTPHAPYDLAPQRYHDLYPVDTTPMPDNVIDPVRADICGYYAHITALDEYVGRLMACLEKNGFAQNTLVVFTSDHGDMLYSHGRVKKQQPWEESIHIPLIMRWPDQLPVGRTSDVLFSVTDMPPTIIHMAGLTVPDDMEAFDLAGCLFGGEGEPSSQPIFDYVPVDQAELWHGRPWRGLRTKTHTYARFEDEGWVLYDNIADPLQMNNLINSHGHRALRESLDAELARWLNRLGDDTYSPETHLRRANMWEHFEKREAYMHPNR